MLLGILKEDECYWEISAVFYAHADRFIESLACDPSPVPADCLFLLNADFHACLTPAVFASDIVFAAGALVQWGWRESEQGMQTAELPLGLVARRVGSVTRSCVVALEQHPLMRPYGSVKNTQDVLNAFQRLRLYGQELYRTQLQRAA